MKPQDFYWEDILFSKYKEFGRNVAEGLDCYGLVLLCCNRAGTPLKDVIYETTHCNSEFVDSAKLKLNIKPLEGPQKGAIVQCYYNNELHSGYMVSKSQMLHMTYEGCRLTPVFAVSDAKFFEVINEN